MPLSVEQPSVLHHGGCLRAAAKRYAIAPEQWLDLSTGINPNAWQVPAIPSSSWARLPEDDDGLEKAARVYYGARQVLPVAGSQAAIQELPRLRSLSRVSVLNPSYAEHAAAWRRAGHVVTPVTAERLNGSVAGSDVLVLANPNNPSGARFPLDQLLDWHAQLAAHSGWLVVDEAFMDVTPESSLCPHSGRPGLIVLRSLGKFFGLAGARVGFVCAQGELLTQLRTWLGPWTVNGPARWVANSALADRDWQETMRQRLVGESARLSTLLAQHRLTPDGGCALFQWLCTPRAAELHEALARRSILTRLFSEPASLRFGLPRNEADWTRLGATLADLTATYPAEAVP